MIWCSHKFFPIPSVQEKKLTLSLSVQYSFSLFSIRHELLRVKTQGARGILGVPAYKNFQYEYTGHIAEKTSICPNWGPQSGIRSWPLH